MTKNLGAVSAQEIRDALPAVRNTPAFDGDMPKYIAAVFRAAAEEKAAATGEAPKCRLHNFLNDREQMHGHCGKEFPLTTPSSAVYTGALHPSRRAPAGLCPACWAVLQKERPTLRV